MRVVTDYSPISVEWFLGDEGDIADWSISPTAMPREFDPKKARLFLEYLQIGMTERQALLEVPVAEFLVRSWKRGSNGAPTNFVDAYARAREQQIHTMAQETIDIADGTDRLSSEYIEETARRVPNPFLPEEDQDKPKLLVEALKVLNNRTGDRIAARRWYASKLLPLNYGDRMQLEHTGNKEKPVSLDYSKLTDAQLEAIAKLDEELNGEG